ncbi:putative malate transporter YflS [compost metagenome]
MCQKFAADLGINITWMSWMWAALIPGIISLIAVPYILYKIYPPELKRTQGATKMASEKLKEMGSVTRNEWLMLIAFFVLLFLWITGDIFKIDATTTAFIGLVFLLLS